MARISRVGSAGSGGFVQIVENLVFCLLVIVVVNDYSPKIVNSQQSLVDGVCLLRISKMVYLPS